MKSSIKPSAAAQQPMIVKYVETTHNGIQSQTLARYAIGYVLRGTKCIYNGDKRQIYSISASGGIMSRIFPTAASLSSRFCSTTHRPTCNASCSI